VVRRFKSHRPLAQALRPVVEQLEARRLLATDPLAYANQVQTLPFALDFTKQVPGLLDATGQSIGLTRVQVNRLGTQYQPQLINLKTASGELDLTTQGTATSGSSYGTDNTLVNALETEFNADSNGFTVTARLKGPLSQISAAYDSGAVYFGPDDDNYVKLDAEFDATLGQTLQFTDEQTATTHTVNAYANIGSFSSITTLDLRLTGNAMAGTITASYSLNGAAYVAIPGTVTLSGAEETLFFNGAARAGIFASTRNSLPPITVPFGHFEIDPGTAVTSGVQPTVAVPHPADGAVNVSRDSFVSIDFQLPNGGIDQTTLYGTNNVQLLRTSDHTVIPSNVTTTGGGDAIILTPKVLLDPNTSYTFLITGGLKDVTGVPFVPFTETFTTGTSGGTTDSTLAFQKTVQTTAPTALYTCVRVGPDGDLWASSEDGRIFRFAINSDGSLGAPQIFTTLQTYEGAQRLVTGFAFDPASTAANPILWVSNSFYSGGNAYYADNAPDFSGKITVMSGPTLSTVWDAVINLPRSIRDHGTEQPTFGPDGALYFGQGSNTSYGAPDVIWGMRPEHLLTAAILRLDTTKVSPGNPLNVQTVDAGGTYNPFAPGAPLTIYASGVRNAFELLWTSGGMLYAPTNGSSAGGNTPAYPNSVVGTRIDQAQNGPYTGPDVPAITDVAEAEDDWLFNIQQGGYYGHPDPTRDEYVLNGGRPTATITDPSQVPDYPVGVLPDRNWLGSTATLDAYGNPTTFDFGQHRSPDGIIQYQGTAFNGALNGKLLIAEYSGGADIAIVTLDAAGNVASIERGVSGLTGFVNPINLAENPATGYIYVADIGAQTITLLKPIPPGAKINVSTAPLTFNSVAPGYSGAGTPSHTDTLTISNTGTVALAFPSDGFTIIPDPSISANDSSAFAITNRTTLPTSVPPGQSFQVQLDYVATAVGPQSALLQIKSNDPTNPILTIQLHGIGTPGQFGYNEPSLVQVLRANDIPTIVGSGPNDSNGSNSYYPEVPDPSSQEVPMQRLVKAGAGPVTITPLASFDTSVQPVLRFGYYTPGDPTDRTELFTINQSDAQTMNPTAIGATSFDPGASTFGLYAIFPGVTTSNGQPDIHYSEDAFNTLDPTYHRKFRFFPLENADGSVVANAYVVAAEDYNSPTYNSFVNFVGIIRNVKAAPGAPNGPVLGLQNLDGQPFTDRLIFNRIQVPNTDQYVQGDVVHDTDTLQIINSGNQPLTVNSLTLSDTTNWQLVSPPATPFTVAANGGTQNVTIKFIAQTSPKPPYNETNDYSNQEFLPETSVGGVYNATLTISSNDPANPSRSVQLAGYWQHHSEFEEEPSLQTLTNLIEGFQTDISNTIQPEYPNNGATPVYYGEEVNAPYWNVADPTLPVSVRMLDAYHNQEFTNTSGVTALTTATVGWYLQSSSTEHAVFSQQPRESQSVLPTIQGSYTTQAFGTFTPTGTFGMYVDGEKSDNTLNTTDLSLGRSGHAIRFYPLRDRSGNLVPNTWLLTMDYQNGTFDNSDFQDVVYLVTNMRPAPQPPAPNDLFAVAPTTGGVSLQWAELAYANATTFNVLRSTSANGTFTQLNGSPLTQTSYFDATAQPGVTYYYHVVAINSMTAVASEATDARAVAAAGVVTGPATPANLTATPSASGIALAWSANTESNLAGYNVLRASSASGPFTQLNPTLLTTPSFNDTTAPQGVVSYYEVVAVDTSNNASAPATISATRPSSTIATSIFSPTSAPASGQQNVSDSGISTAGGVTLGLKFRSDIAGLVTGVRFYKGSLATGTQAGELWSSSGQLLATATFTSETASGWQQVSFSNAVAIAANTTYIIAYRTTSPDIAYTSNYFATVGVDNSPLHALANGVDGNNGVYHYDTTPGVSVFPNLYNNQAPNYWVDAVFSAVPAAPTGLTATANSATQVALSWTASATAASYRVLRQGPSDPSFVQIGTATATTFTDTQAQSNTSYSYEVIAVNTYGNSSPSQPASATTPQQQAGSLTSLDINASLPGSTTVIQNGTDYDVVAGGPAIYNTADGFRFVYEPFSGDFDMKVRLNSISVSTTGVIDQAGLMARATLDPSSPNVFVSASPASGYRFKYRTTQAGATSGVTSSVATTYPNVWVRLTRSANVFTSYYSSDGVNWTQIGSITVAMTDPIYIGLAAAANTTTATITAQFRSFEATALPDPVTSLSAAAPDSGHVSLLWSAAPGATSYTIQRQGPGDTSFVNLAQNLTGTTYSDSTVQSGVSYSYRVIAVNTTGPSAAFTPTASAAVPIPGDADRDGTVNFADLVLVSQNYGKTNATWDMGDFNGDGTVDFADLVILGQNYGKA